MKTIEIPENVKLTFVFNNDKLIKTVKLSDNKELCDIMNLNNNWEKVLSVISYILCDIIKKSFKKLNDIIPEIFTNESVLKFVIFPLFTTNSKHTSLSLNIDNAKIILEIETQFK